MSKNTKATAVERAIGDEILAHFGVEIFAEFFDEMLAMILEHRSRSDSPALVTSRDSRDEIC
jgi:hypothetical protein